MKISLNVLKKEYLLFLFGAAAALFVSCDDDTVPIGHQTIDILDPNAVSDALSITGATLVNGNMPAPTPADADAPQLLAAEEPATAVFVGENLRLSIKLGAGTYTGIYFKIKGASKYYNISANSLSEGSRVKPAADNGRLQFSAGLVARPAHKYMEETTQLKLPIPENIRPGNLCVQYAVYDDAQRVSNIVEQCVQVLSMAGSNSGFLSANDWELAYSWELVNDQRLHNFVGDIRYDSLYRNWPCKDGSIQNIEMEVGWGREHEYLTLSPNGLVAEEKVYLQTEKLLPDGPCEMEPYQSTTRDRLTLSGNWSYNDALKHLVIISSWDSVGVDYSWVSHYKADMLNNQLVLETIAKDGSIGKTGLVYNRR